MKNPNTNDVCTNLIRYFQLQRYMDIHQKRIKNVEPTLKQLREHTGRKVGSIKKQPLAQFNRIMTIDIQNKALLKKLTDKSPSNIGKERPIKIAKNNRGKVLLNYKHKVQNEGLLKRIKQVKSSYQNLKFASQRKITQSYINSISKFGYKNFTPNKTIMYPFYKKMQQRVKPIQKCISHQNSLINSQVKQIKQNQKITNHDQKQDQVDCILSIQTRQWNQGDIKAKITYVIWKKRITIQIDVFNSQDSMSLQIPRKTFIQQFYQSVKNLQKSIKYDKENQYFYIDA